MSTVRRSARRSATGGSKLTGPAMATRPLLSRRKRRSTLPWLPGVVDKEVAWSDSGATARTAAGLTARSSNRMCHLPRSSRATLNAQGGADACAAAEDGGEPAKVVTSKIPPSSRAIARRQTGC